MSFLLSDPQEDTVISTSEWFTATNERHGYDGGETGANPPPPVYAEPQYVQALEAVVAAARAYCSYEAENARILGYELPVLIQRVVDGLTALDAA